MNNFQSRFTATPDKQLILYKIILEVVAQSCSVKKVFVKISQKIIG